MGSNKFIRSSQLGRAAGLGLIAGLAVGATFGGGVAASAGTNDGICNSNEVCVFKDTNYGNPRSDFLYNYADMNGGIVFHTYNYPASCNLTAVLSCRLNDSISSISNLSDHRSIRFFTDANYDGNSQKVVLLHAVPTVTYNDQYSSECWNDGGVPPSVDPDCTFPN